VHLRVAGFTVELTCSEPDVILAPSPAAAHFTIEPASPDVRLRVTTRPVSNDDAGDRLFDSGGPWQLFRHGDGYLFRFSSPSLGPAPYKCARLSPDFRSGDIWLNRAYLTAGHPVDPLEYPLDELLIIHLLAQGHGIEVHACGLVDAAGVGYLFVGQSGAGKTTIARLWLDEPGTVILSDDRVVLRADADGLWMYGTPWHGEEPLASPQRARLVHLFFLRHHMRQTIAPVSRPDAAARLFAASFPPFHSAPALEFTLGFIERVVGSVGCHELGFTPTASVRDFVRTHLSQPSRSY
jgi:hypothetical protein